MTEPSIPSPRMSDKLALSAAISVLMMTTYVLFGGDAASASFAASGADTPVRVAALSGSPLEMVFAGARPRALLY